ncbi:MAG TPA: hypothetical protein DCM68_05190 [Verrucomicrobia bacterium]|nr:hypothetical protein [Verrucomicrobiota bacterium]
MWAGSVFADTVEFTGYWKSFLSATDVRDSYRRLGLWDNGYLADDVERVRLKFQCVPSGELAFGMHYEAVLHWGDTVKLRPRLEESAILPERPRFMQLEDEILDDGAVQATHGLDRLWVRLEPSSRLQLTFGRQAVGWGTGLIWSPSDLFAAFSPTEIDREERVGVDVARLILQPHSNLSLDVVGEPLDLEQQWTANADDSSLVARLGTHVGEYDLHLCGGVVQSDLVLGGDFAGNLGDAGFRGEALQTWVDESGQRDYFRGLLGLDYGFAWAWNPYVAVEYYYNGLGEADPADYAPRRMETSVRRVFERGIAYNIGRDYLGGTFRIQPNALLTFQATTLANLHDGSFREFATLAWSVAEDFDLIFGADFGIGAGGGEFTGLEGLGLPDLYFLHGKFYF